MITICFTGHRPDKLGGYDWNTLRNKKIMEKLKTTIIELINSKDENYFHFVCGGALGIDQMAFDIVQDIKENTLKLSPINITIEVALPFLKQDIKWNDENRIKWRQQLTASGKVTRVDKLEDYKINGYEDDIYYPAKMQKRNEYMVDKSDIVIAVWNGTKGGTANCINYAKKHRKEIISINPDKI